MHYRRWSVYNHAWGGGGALFITVFRPQTHSSAYHRIPSEKHAGWLAPSVNQAHPFSSDITYINDFYRFMLSPDSKTSQHIRIFSFTCYTLYTKVLYDGIYAASNSVFWYLKQAQAKTKKYNMQLAINYIWTSGSYRKYLTFWEVCAFCFAESWISYIISVVWFA